ncbi:citramalate synthase [Phaeovibrio sulfidiphilus]|uniref:Citramalate synthase n=1 Tax=Phaeovibrio sulfidiphilus TaxID=1220600 RepID=A0A8J6YXD6_9PROT|nr:citramalate synthase [Phaeovibrio sulfidiphilus]MBE1236428.1 citramalate synthase [Phaeovibrio sulfidiphilus]
MNDKRIYLYDTTLRDGAQTMGVDFSVADKIAIARALDELGFDYIEGGWPGANDTDTGFFANAPALHTARLSAFGMTRRAGISASNDPGLRSLLQCGATVLTLVGKSWDFQCTEAIGVELPENLRMISDSIALVAGEGREVMFDAEHFFDGYKDNPEYALSCLKAAHDAGARWVVLCDTNGGTLPHEVGAIVSEVVKVIPGTKVGIHCHNDTENGVANAIAAVCAGARQIQGTLNGLGERCGNTNLVSLIPTLILKMGFETGISRDKLPQIAHVSRMLDERLNRAPDRHAPYVGASAFAHKGGLHASAVERNPRCYEHVTPESVGNTRQILVSKQAGRANVIARFRELGITVEDKDPRIATLLETVKKQESVGYAFEGAEASFELMAHRHLAEVPKYYTVDSFRVIDERRYNAVGKLVVLSEATVKLHVGGDRHMAVAEGNGPVDALNTALRKVLTAIYPVLENLRLVDFKVRILTPDDATGAVTRVMIESMGPTGERYTTVGVSTNIIEASFEALMDAFDYCLFRAGRGD